MLRYFSWGRLGIAVAVIAICFIALYVIRILVITWTLLVIIKVIGFIGTVIGHLGG